MKKWLAPAVLVVLVLTVAACTDDQYLWWERQGDEISDEDVREFCADRLEYCSEAADRLTTVVDELRGPQNGATGTGSERSINIVWGKRHYGYRALHLPEPYRSWCGAYDRFLCWTLHYEFVGDWAPPYRVECYNNGKPFHEFEADSMYWSASVGCIYKQRVGWSRSATGTAQVVINGVGSNLLPSQ